jgi:hypothetical protein
MFDVFYSGIKPNVFVHEQQADTIQQAQELSRTRYFWWVNYLTDYSGHDFLYEPVPWEANQTHIWPSQHQVNGGTYLVPKTGTAEYNRNHPVLKRKQSVSIIGIDHGEGIAVKCDITTRYISDYLGTLRRVLAKTASEYVWVISSVCDYRTFDFTWHPSEWQSDMLHVFASDNQKFGDTFYIHVPSFLKKTEKLALLEWFETIHFVPDVCVPRRPMPTVLHDCDSQIDAVKAHEFITPVALFSTMDIETNYIPSVNLWREPVKTITPLTAGASIIVVPREAKNHLIKQLYDYPYIDRTQRHMYTDISLDIVFIDNGEPNAETNYEHLCDSVRLSEKNCLHRSTGVTGPAAAYRAAAELSTTPWFFAVFAKLQIEWAFDWAWQPDRLQEPKHYIFHARNPVNGLTYGHQAMIAYNRELVLTNTAEGLDFTLDQAHEVVPILSGVANYHYDAWTCWRTAFRECIKLQASLPNIENEYRLNQWLTKDITKEQWSLRGAKDAIEYYNSVDGNFAELKKSYDWAWLASYALVKRNLPQHQ